MNKRFLEKCQGCELKETAIARSVVMLIGSGLSVCLAYSQAKSGAAELCYKVVSPCFVQVEEESSPVGFWFVVSLYCFMGIALFLGAIKQVRLVLQR